MKILVVTFEFPPGLGGMGTYAYQMAKEFSRVGHRVTVAAHTNHAEPERVRNFDARAPFRILRYRACGNKVEKIIHRTRRTWDIVAKGDFEVLLIPYPNAGILGYWLKKRFHLPYAMTAHGTEFVDNGAFVTRVLRMSYAGADVALPNSAFTRALMMRAGVHCRRTEVVPLGADPSLYDYRESPVPAGLRKQYDAEGRKVVLTVGGLRRIKGHRTVIEAVKQLKERIPEILYLIVGRGPEERRLREMITEMGLENHVRLEGPAEWERLREYYALCDVFVLNSTRESFGIVLVEAGLMGKPVVAAETGGIPEVVKNGETGLLVPPGDASATAEAVESLLRDGSKAERMGAAGYRRAKERFIWKHVAAKTEKALEAIVAGRR